MPAETTNYDLPYPLASDSVNVHEDIQDLAEAIDAILPTLGLPYHTLEVSNTSGVTITKGDPVYIIGHGATKPRVAKCNANTSSTFPVIGLAQANITNTSDGVVILTGVFSGVNTSAFTSGDVLYVAGGGGLTTTPPISTTINGVGNKAVGVVAKAASSGVIIVGPVRGAGTWQSLKNGLS
jgi:hypothetical protein